MKKVIRLTERDLAKIIKKVISETQDNSPLFGLKMRSIFIDRKPDGTLGDNSTVTLSNGEILKGTQIPTISDECNGSDVNALDQKCSVGISTNKFDLMCSKSGCSKMK